MRYFFAVLCLGGALYGQQQTLHLTRVRAEKLALQNNPHITAASLTAAAAYQVPNMYRASYAPNVFSSVTGVGSDSGSRLAAGGLNNPIVYNRLGSGMSVTQMITDFGRTGNLVGMAKLHAAAEDQITETARAQILLATDRAYYGVLRAQSELRVAEQTVKERQLIVDQVSALAQSKLKSMLDVSFANVNLADAKLLLVQAQNDLQAARAELATAMGIPGQTAFDLSEEPMPEPLPDRVGPMIHAALQERPELKNLRLEQSAAERFTRAEHALFFPYVGVVGTAGFVPTGQEAIPGKYGAIGLNVTIPIFNGGLFRARQTEAELKAKAATQNIADLENRITRDVRVSFLNATTAYDRLGLTDQLLKQAQLALDLAQSRYDLGLSSIVELSQAQLNLTSAQIANAGARYDYQTQRSVLDYQTGALH